MLCMLLNNPTMQYIAFYRCKIDSCETSRLSVMRVSVSLLRAVEETTECLLNVGHGGVNEAVISDTATDCTRFHWKCLIFLQMNS